MLKMKHLENAKVKAAQKKISSTEKNFNHLPVHKNYDTVNQMITIKLFGYTWSLFYSVDKADSGQGTYHKLFFIFFPNSHPRESI